MAYESSAAKTRNRYVPGDVSSESRTVTGRLDTYVLTVLPQDLVAVIRSTAKQELAAQVSVGNPPSQILVDGRSVADRDISSALKRVSIRFADTTMLLSAVRDVYNALLRVTRIEQPPKNEIVARQHYHLYVNGKPAGRLPAALGRLQADSIDYKTVLRVVGPLVPYGRKMFWNPIGRAAKMNIRATVSAKGRTVAHYGSPFSPRFKPYSMRTIRRVANSQGGNPAENLKRLLDAKPGYVEGTAQIVKRIMRRDRRYAGLYFSDAWIDFGPARFWGKKSRDARVPSVSVQLARKGQVRLKL